jgi:seryl-tRNA synthetase
MIDIKLIREKPEIVRENLKRRQDTEKMRMFERFLELDKMWRENVKEIEALRAKRNKLSKQIADAKKAGKPVEPLLEDAKKIPEKIAALEEMIKKQEVEMRTILLRLPNLLHESVPFGRDDNDNLVVKHFSQPRKFDFEPRHHQDIAAKLGGVDIERAAKISGARFYFLKGPLVKLNFALINYAMDFITKKGFSLIQPPYMINRASVEGATDLGDFETMIYKIESEDLYLIATSEHPMLAMHSNETFLADELPKKLAGYSPCFRKEAGTHGKDEKGFFRVHQFDKVEQFIFCKPEESWDMHEYLLKNTEEFFASLQIPYRVVNVCTGDIGTVAAKKYDIEAWMPAQNKYREVASCSNCTDYQARRLNIKWRKKEGAAPEGFVHTLNNTLVATQRAMVAILENFQNEDFSVDIPKVLWPYINMKRLEPVK